MTAVEDELLFLKKRLATTSSSTFIPTLNQLIAFAGKLAANADVTSDQLLEAFELLNAFLKSKDHHYLKPSAAEFSPLLQLLDSRLSSQQTVQLLKCISSFIKRIELADDDEKHRTCSETLKRIYANFERWIHTTGDESVTLAIARVLLATTQAIKASIVHLRLSPTDEHKVLGQLLAILRVLLFVGFPGYDLSKHSLSPLYAAPINLHMVADTASDSQAKVKVDRYKSKRRNKSKNRTAEDEPLLDRKSEPSDSEMSASDFDFSLAADLQAATREVFARTRYNAYELMEIVAKQTDKRAMFGYWSSLIPDTPSPTQQHTVLTSIVKDHSPRVRCAAFVFLRELLFSGRQFVLTLAASKHESKKQTTSFTPLSVTLASMVTEIHRAFDGFFFVETASEVLVQGLKCLSALVSASPYAKLHSGLIVQLMKKMDTLFKSTHDVAVLSAAATAFNDIFEAGSTQSELREFLTTADGAKMLCGLLQFAFRQVSDPKNARAYDWLKFLTTTLRHNYAPQSFIADTLQLAIEMANCEHTLSNPNFQMQFCKFVNACVTVDKQSDQVALHCNEVEWWRSLVNTKLVQTAFGQSETSLHDQSVVVIIETLSLLRPDIYDAMPRPLTYHLLVLLFSKCAVPRDDDNFTFAITSAAVRCLGVFVMFPSNQDDWTFLSDIATNCVTLVECAKAADVKSRDTVTLLTQATWTSANLCEVLNRSSRTNCEFGIEESVCSEQIEMLVSCFAVAPSGIPGESIRINLVRAVSNLSSVLLSKFVRSQQANTVVSESASLIIELLAKGKSFKVHWNCCFALTMLLNNSEFQQLISADSAVTCRLISTLENVLMSTKNHKVMSSAAETLAACAPLLDESKRIALTEAICDLFIEKFYSAPDVTKLKWIDKMACAICKLSENGQRGAIDCCTKLSLFVRENLIEVECNELDCIQTLKSISC